MARIRTIKPGFWTNEDLSALPEPTHMLAAALLNYSDDEGYFNANVGLIKAECSPLREPSVSIQDSLVLLVSAGYIQLGTTRDGKRYGQVIGFDEHQVVNRPTPSKIKGLAIEWDSSDTPQGIISEPSSLEGKGKEGKGREARAKPKLTPLPDGFSISERVRAWATEKGWLRLDEHFAAFCSKARAKAYVYADWDEAFMEAVRKDWAGLGKSGADVPGGGRVRLGGGK